MLHGSYKQFASQGSTACSKECRDSKPDISASEGGPLSTWLTKTREKIKIQNNLDSHTLTKTLTKVGSTFVANIHSTRLACFKLTFGHFSKRVLGSWAEKEYAPKAKDARAPSTNTGWPHPPATSHHHALPPLPQPPCFLCSAA